MVYHDIICDGCGTDLVGFPPIEIKKRGPDRDRLHQIRFFCKASGWRVNLPGGKDYCPKCWEEMKNGFGKC